MGFSENNKVVNLQHSLNSIWVVAKTNGFGMFIERKFDWEEKCTEQERIFRNYKAEIMELENWTVGK